MELFAVIGLKRFGYRVARSLTEKGGEVIAIDIDPQLVEAAKDYVTQAICLDATDEQAMRAAGLADVTTAVVAIGGNREASILSTAILHRLGVGRIIARAGSLLHAQILEAVGAHEVLIIEDEMGEELARKIIHRDIVERTRLALDTEIIQIQAPHWMVGKTLAALDLRKQYRLNVIGLKRRVPVVDDYGETHYETQFINLPDPYDEINRDDILILTGSTESIEQLLRESEEGA